MIQLCPIVSKVGNSDTNRIQSQLCLPRGLGPGQIALISVRVASLAKIHRLVVVGETSGSVVPSGIHHE